MRPFWCFDICVYLEKKKIMSHICNAMTFTSLLKEVRKRIVEADRWLEKIKILSLFFVFLEK